MIDPAASITVFDGMATLAGVRPARAASGKAVTPVEPVRRTFDDRADLSDHGLPLRGKAVAQEPALGRLIDVLA
jgi:hypothetical protein